MQKKFITNLAFLLFLNLFIKAFWLLGIDRIVQQVTGAEAYGQYYALFNFSFLFNILLDLGITNFNNRNISQNQHLLEKHLSGIIVLRMFLAFGYLLVSLAASWFMGYDLFQMEMLLVLFVNQIFISFILYLRSNLAGLQLFKTDSIISVLDRTIMIAICSVLLWGNITESPFRIEWFIWIQTAGYVITALVTFLILAKKSRFTKLQWNPLFYLMILKQSYPFAILILLMTFYNRIDTVMLERLLPEGAMEAGIYAQAYRILDATNMIAYLFAALLLPMFSSMLKKREDIRDLLRLSYSLLVVPAIIIAAVAIFYGYPIMELLYKEHIRESAIIFSILMSCFVAIATTYIYGTLLTANGNLRYLNLMAFAGMIFNITVNFVMIPKFHVVGAAITSLVTQFGTAAVQVFICYRLFRLKTDLTLIGKFLLFSLILITVAWVLKMTSLSWIISVIAIAFAGLTTALILNLISIRGMLYILKNEK